MMGPVSPLAGKPELASREPSALALAIIAALTLAVSTDQLGTASAAAQAWETAQAFPAEHDTIPDQATA